MKFYVSRPSLLGFIINDPESRSLVKVGWSELDALVSQHNSTIDLLSVLFQHFHTMVTYQFS
jgi:hypothetical protein